MMAVIRPSGFLSGQQTGASAKYMYLYIRCTCVCFPFPLLLSCYAGDSRHVLPSCHSAGGHYSSTGRWAPRGGVEEEVDGEELPLDVPLDAQGLAELAALEAAAGGMVEGGTGGEWLASPSAVKSAGSVAHRQGSQTLSAH